MRNCAICEKVPSRVPELPCDENWATGYLLSSATRQNLCSNLTFIIGNEIQCKLLRLQLPLPHPIRVHSTLCHDANRLGTFREKQLPRLSRCRQLQDSRLRRRQTLRPRCPLLQPFICTIGRCSVRHVRPAVVSMKKNIRIVRVVNGNSRSRKILESRSLSWSRQRANQSRSWIKRRHSRVLARPSAAEVGSHANITCDASHQHIILFNYRQSQSRRCACSDS